MFLQSGEGQLIKRISPGEKTGSLYSSTNCATELHLAQCNACCSVNCLEAIVMVVSLIYEQYWGAEKVRSANLTAQLKTMTKQGCMAAVLLSGGYNYSNNF